MRRGSTKSWVLAGVLGLVASALPAAAEDKPLTAGDNGREVVIKPGDTIHFQLLTNSRSGWTWEKLGKDTVLDKPRDVYKSVEGSVFSTQDAYYPVRGAVEKPTKFRWIYCKFGRPVEENTGKPLVPKERIRPGQDPEEGMVFELTLRPSRS